MPWLLAVGVGLFVGFGLVLARRDRQRLAAPAEPAPATDYVADVIAALDQRGLEAKPVPDTFALEIAGGHWLDLRAGYGRYADGATAAQRSASVDQLLSGWERQGLLTPRGAPVEELAQQVIPEILPMVELSLRILERQLAADDPASIEIESQPGFWSLGAGLAARPALLDGRMFRALEAGALSLTEVAAFELMEANLSRIARAHPFRGIGAGVLRSGFEDPRDATVLLLPRGALAELGIGGRLLIWPLRADTVFLADADDEAALAAVFEQVERLDGLHRPLSRVPLVRGGGERWRPLQLPDVHPLSGALRRRRREQILERHARLSPPLATLAARGHGLAPAPLVEEGERLVAIWEGPALISAEVDAIRVEVDGQRSAISPRQLEAAGLSRHWISTLLVAQEPPSHEILSGVFGAEE